VSLVIRGTLIMNHEAQGIYQFHQTLTEFRRRILKRDTFAKIYWIIHG
jgi:hypothetical protein